MLEQVDKGSQGPVCKEDYTGEKKSTVTLKPDTDSSYIVLWLELHDAWPVCRKSLNGEDSTQQTELWGFCKQQI